jgi:hypothetical protein
MKDPRRTGLLLLLTATALFAASADDVIPAEAFFIGVLLAPLGAVLFMTGNREATEEFERQLERNLNPTLKNTVAMKNADLQAQQNLQHNARRGHVAHSVNENRVFDGELLLCDISETLETLDDNDEAMKIETDVSFPVEVQEHEALADQLEKLRRLAADGALSQKEFEAAKARLLA